MWTSLQRRGAYLLTWCVLSALGGYALARFELAQLREAFETDARIAHRLLSQRAVQHDAVLAMLALLQPAADGTDASAAPEQRLSSVYPQILAVQHSPADGRWADPTLAAAEARSRQSHTVVLATADLPHGRFQLLLAAQTRSYALLVDLRSMVPWDEWPMAPDSSPVRLTLEHAGQVFVLQPGRIASGGWRFDFHKHLATDSQPFDVFAIRQVGWAELPWGWMLAWSLAVAAALAALQALQRQHAQRRRAEELLRLGQVARLNTLGELAAGMAHELNQPLTALLANTQAAGRLLDENPPEHDTARHAMAQAVEQARRAAAVVGRLRRAVERPDLAGPLQAVSLQDTVRSALYLLEPECARCGVRPTVHAATPVPNVLAEPVALEQIVHNLLMNALQALEQVPEAERQLDIHLRAENGQGVLLLQDSGPGIPAEVLPRIFEPFFSTRQGGLGLGLNLCESLASGLGGTLHAQPASPRGAIFRLTLPLAP